MDLLHLFTFFSCLSFDVLLICLRNDSASFFNKIASHLEGIVLDIWKFNVEVVEGAVIDLQDLVTRTHIVVDHLSTAGNDLEVT